MRVKILSLTVVLILVLIVALPASAEGWQHKVTGGGQAVVGNTNFSVSVAAWDDGNGGIGGNIQYSRPGVMFHAKVECVNFFANGKVTVAGYGWNQEGTTYLAEPYWVAVAINEGGNGAGDSVRVWPVAEGTCPSTSSFPGHVWDGNFNIRSK